MTTLAMKWANFEEYYVCLISNLRRNGVDNIAEPACVLKSSE